MENKIIKHCIAAGILLLGLANVLSAQSLYKVNDSKENTMKMSGTSTFHDWDMQTELISGEGQFGFLAGNTDQLTSIKSLTFSLLVQDLKSGERGLDDNAYKALNTDEYKNIIYKLIAAKVTSLTENKFLVKTVGNLKIAGVTKKIYMDVYCVINSNGTITSTGTYHLKMTDYHVKPPTFMLGVIKTGDAITLDFQMIYTKQPGT